MPYIQIYYQEDNIVCAYWQSGKYFYRQYENETRAKRISETEYMSAYAEYRNI